MRLRQIAQRVIDMDASVAFYAELLHSEPTARFDAPAMAFFDLGGIRLMLDPKAPSAIIYLQVEDLTSQLDRMANHGRVLVEPRPLFTHRDDTLGRAGTVEWQGEIADPAGNVVGLLDYRSAG